MATNKAIIHVTPELLKQALKLPSGVNIVDSERMAFNSDVIPLMLEGQGLPTVPEGGVIPLIPIEEVLGE